MIWDCIKFCLKINAIFYKKSKAQKGSQELKQQNINFKIYNRKKMMDFIIKEQCLTFQFYYFL